MDDTRQVAATLARGRAVTGLVMVLLPGLVGRLWLGADAARPQARALTRMLGARDVVLGIGALTSVRERTQGPEWLSMGAVADGVDALVCLLGPGLPRRGRLVALVAGGAAVLGMKVARDLADERDEALLPAS